MSSTTLRFLSIFAPLALGVACGGGSPADALGVGAECTSTSQCAQNVNPPLVCLTQFRGGYCGLSACTGDADCPTDALCVTHTDGLNYCFRTCTDKTECNAHRTTANESNCSSNITRVDGGTEKACVPPAG